MMEPLFSSGVLERIASSDALLGFDFDGTLAPIVDDPALATMRTATRRLLAQVAQLYPCAVISGRSEEDLLQRLGGVTVWYVVGNRALQPPEQTERLARQVKTWGPALVERLAQWEGIAIEDKLVSLAVHYRHAREHDRARRAIAEAAALLDGVRVIPGKEVINLVPEGGPNKGAALERIRLQLGCPAGLYVGDDQSDEDVFAVGRAVAGVRVGRHDQSVAPFYIGDQRDMDELLERLIELRPRRCVSPEAVDRSPMKKISAR
jgi:trehalose 6-phosphate phosphatase